MPLNLASQVVGVATGMQDDINWRGVAAGALTGAITGGVGAAGGAATGGFAGNALNISNVTAQAVTNAMIGNAASQGINIALGQQQQFSWTQLAMSGASSYVVSGTDWGSKLQGDPYGRHALQAGSNMVAWGIDHATGVDNGKGSAALISAIAGAVGGMVGDALNPQASLQRSQQQSGSASTAGGTEFNEQATQEEVVKTWSKDKAYSELAKTAMPLEEGVPQRAQANSIGGGWNKATYVARDLSIETLNPIEGTWSNSGGGKRLVTADMRVDSATGVEIYRIPETDPIAGREVRMSVGASVETLTPVSESAAERTQKYWADQKYSATNFGSYFGAHLMGLFGRTGHELIDAGQGVYRLVTDERARDNARASVNYLVRNPQVVKNAVVDGAISYWNKPFAEKADSAFVGLVGGLATAGGGKALSAAGNASLDVAKWAAPKLAESAEALMRSQGMILDAAPQGPRIASEKGVSLSATQLRNTPGVATASGDLMPATGRWLDPSVPTSIPSQVGDALTGQKFNSFDDFRSAIWEEIGNSSKLNGGFSRANLAQLQAGNSPYVPSKYLADTGAFGERFNLHHVDPISNGGAVYDLSNIQIVSPKTHFDIHYGFGK